MREPILFHSNAPWVGTGYGAQTKLNVPALAGLGYRMAYSAFFGLKGQMIPVGNPPIPCYPGHRSVYGNDIIEQHWDEHSKGESGLVITLTDPWVLDTEVFAGLPTLAWTPVDHAPLMPMTRRWFEKSGAIPLAMSRHGERMFKDAGLDSLYVPHAYDPEVFQPIPRPQARKALGLPQDKFIVGMVAANTGVPSRKNFSGAVQAFERFHDEHPDSILYMHTNVLDPEGENIQDLCDACGIRVYCTDQYQYAKGMPTAHVALLCNAFDVLLNPSIGEGFGCPMVEANACGTPVITTNWAANPEVSPSDAGNWNAEGDRIWTGFDSFQKYPFIQNLVECLEEAYEMKDSKLLRSTVAEHARQYEIGHVTETHWKPVIKEALERAQDGDVQVMT